jgi:hypothetical protein
MAQQVYIVMERYEDGDVAAFADAFRTLADAQVAITTAYVEQFDEEDRADLELPQVAGGGSCMWVDNITWYITAVTLPT